MSDKNEYGSTNQQIDYQRTLIEDLMINEKDIVLTDEIIKKYDNYYWCELIPDIEDSKYFGLVPRSWGRFLTMMFTFPPSFKIDLLTTYQRYKNGKFKGNSEEKKTGRIIRYVWDKYNKFLKSKNSSKIGKGFVYFVGSFPIDSDLYQLAYGEEEKPFYVKIGYTENLDERFDRLDDGHNPTAFYMRSLLLLEAEAAYEKYLFKLFKKDRVINKRGYRKGKQKGEYFRVSDDMVKFVYSNKYRDLTPKMSLMIEYFNKRMNEIYYEKKEVDNSMALVEFIKQVKYDHSVYKGSFDIFYDEESDDLLKEVDLLLK